MVHYTKTSAEKHGERMLALMKGCPGWTVKIWENHGWCVALFNNGMTIMDGSPLGDPLSQFYVYFNMSNTVGSSDFEYDIETCFKDPLDAVKAQMVLLHKKWEQLTAKVDFFKESMLYENQI